MKEAILLAGWFKKQLIEYIKIKINVVTQYLPGDEATAEVERLMLKLSNLMFGEPIETESDLERLEKMTIPKTFKAKFEHGKLTISG